MNVSAERCSSEDGTHDASLSWIPSFQFDVVLSIAFDEADCQGIKGVASRN